MSFFTQRLTIIGVGLIGGSLARRLKKMELVGEVVGVNRSEASLNKALELGVIDRGTHDPLEGVDGADMVLVATPVNAIPAVVRQFAPALAPGAVVTDAGSAKERIVAACEDLMPEGAHFVGGHPIAGREFSGVEASVADLYEGARTVLTLTQRTDEKALERVRDMWEATGSIVDIMEPAYHDQVLAATSHLPHLIAYTTMHTLADLGETIPDEVFRLAAGAGFKDFTRIASSDPAMWRDVSLMNREALLEFLNRFQEHLDDLKRRVDEGDADGLYGAFARSKKARDRILVVENPQGKRIDDE